MGILLTKEHAVPPRHGMPGEFSNLSREDDQQPLDPDVREALLELQRYLSDSLAPLMVSDAINLLLDYPADLAANEIQAWMTAQFRSARPAAVSDYLYHAVEKIHAMGQYHLVPKDSLLRYLEELKPLVLASCPPADKALLTQNLGRLGQTESILAAPVEILRRQGGLAGGENVTASRGGGGFPAAPSHLQELSLLIERLGPLLASGGFPVLTGEGGPAPGGTLTARGGGAALAAAGAALVAGAATSALPGASAERRDVLLSQILSVAAMAARTDGELHAALDKLRSLGIDVPTSELFRTLGRSIPQWPVSSPSTPLEQALSNAKGAPTAAMRRIVTLPENPEEVGRRFNEMVGAAVEQLNQGSLARASRMLDVAEKIVSENHVETATAENVRRRAQEAVDLERVRSLGEDPRNHEALGRILSFFPGFTPGRFIEELHGEEKRERRRLLLSLLEIHGAKARATALALLDELRTGDPAHDWHFKRNLLYLVRRIPRATRSRRRRSSRRAVGTGSFRGPRSRRPPPQGPPGGTAVQGVRPHAQEAGQQDRADHRGALLDAAAPGPEGLRRGRRAPSRNRLCEGRGADAGGVRRAQGRRGRGREPFG